MSLAVKGCPSCHVMPGRMLKVHVSPSCDWVQLSATPGAACSVDLSKFWRRSKFSANTSYSGVSIAFHGFTVRMLLTVPSMKVPPDPPADAAAEADAEALALCAHAVPAASSTTIRPLSRTRSPLRTFLMWSLLPWELRVGSYVPLRPWRHAGLVDRSVCARPSPRLHATAYRRRRLAGCRGGLCHARAAARCGVLGGTGAGPAECCPEGSAHVRRSGPLLLLDTVIRPARCPHRRASCPKAVGNASPLVLVIRTAQERVRATLTNLRNSSVPCSSWRG